jgi:hypothetical protein
VNLVYVLVPKCANCQYRYGEAHYQYWYEFWYRLPHTQKFTSSHLPYFVNFVLASLLHGIYHTLSLSSLSLAYCTVSISPSRVVTVQLCRIPTPLQATSSHLRCTHTSLETPVASLVAHLADTMLRCWAPPLEAVDHRVVPCVVSPAPAFPLVVLSAASSRRLSCCPPPATV